MAIKKKQPEDITPEVEGYDKGKYVNFAGDSMVGEIPDVNIDEQVNPALEKDDFSEDL